MIDIFWERTSNTEGYQISKKNNVRLQKKNNANTGIQPFSTLEIKAQNLIREATEVRSFAYCPYSNFQVGAALLCTDGTIYKGCNVENNSFTVGICAERTAYVKAISEGKRKFSAVAVVAYQEDSFTTPCGACRQFMSEFGDVPVYITKPSYKDVLVSSVSELLPYMFTTKDNTFK